MKLAIVGSRDFNDYELFCQMLSNFITDVDIIISGGCRGTDTLAKRYANENKIHLVEIYPEWKKYGKTAGPIRNKQIIEECDYILAFPSKNGKGTQNVIDNGKDKVFHIEWID